MGKAKDLDQFFTTRERADHSITTLLPILEELGYPTDPHTLTFLEPSAGSGNFVDALHAQDHTCIATDIDPQRDDIQYADYLQDDITHLLPHRDHTIVIGNPPFGKRSTLAVDFINHALTHHTDTIAFILPIQFIKYLTQKRITAEAKLIHNEKIDADSFTFQNKAYSVRSVFQIWTLKDLTGTHCTDHRIRMRPQTTHPDFTMLLYNCTEDALPMFDAAWDFAVHRQGWSDFHPIDRDETTTLDRKKQWMFFRSDDEEVIRRLKALDYNAIGEKNTSVRGFGKADIVEEYTALYGRNEQQPLTLFSSTEDSPEHNADHSAEHNAEHNEHNASNVNTAHNDHNAVNASSASNEDTENTEHTAEDTDDTED